MRQAVRVLLEGAGFEVAEAGDGTEAVRSLRTRGADLVRCDVFPAGEDGLEVLRRVPQEFPGVKVIAMSGGPAKGAGDRLPEARLLRAEGVLYNPLDRFVVLAAVQRVLRTPSDH